MRIPKKRMTKDILKSKQMEIKGELWEIVNLGELWEMLEAGGTKGDPDGGTVEGDHRCTTFITE